MDHSDLSQSKHQFGDPMPENYLYSYNAPHQFHNQDPQQWQSFPAEYGTYTGHSYGSVHGSVPETGHYGNAYPQHMPYASNTAANTDTLHSGSSQYNPLDQVRESSNFGTHQHSSSELAHAQPSGQEHSRPYEHRPSKLKKYQWQRDLDVDVLMNLYDTFSQMWGTRARVTYYEAFHRLNRKLADDANLLQSVLSGDYDAIELANLRGGPGPAVSKPKKGATMNPEQFLRWIENDSVFDRNKSKWTLNSAVSPPELQELAGTLGGFWKMKVSDVKKRLRHSDPHVFEKNLPIILGRKNEDYATVRNAANDLFNGSMDGASHSSQNIGSDEQDEDQYQPGDINVSDYEIEEPHTPNY